MKSSSTHLPSLLGSLVFVLGAVIMLGIAALLAAITLGRLLTGGQVEVRETMMLAITGFEGLLLLAATYFSIQKVRGNPSADAEVSYTITAWQIAVLLIVAGTAIAIGQQILGRQPINWLLIPILTLTAVLLPILVLLGLGIRSISLGPRWRAWNIAGISMTLVPLITFILETLVMVFIFAIVVLYIFSQPDLIALIEKLTVEIDQLDTDPERMIEMFAPYIFRPGVITIVLLFFSVLIPLIEELVKPLGVWLFSTRISSPAQGFALGALSGAAFALIETLGVSPQTDEWSVLLLTRLGTDILHVTTSALMGAGIVYAIRQQRYPRLLGTYFLCVSLHGLWNGLAMLFSFASLAEQYNKQSSLSNLTIPAGIGVAVYAAILLIVLITSNRRMRALQPTLTGEELVS